jgi:hypothetical protein
MENVAFAGMTNGNLGLRNLYREIGVGHQGSNALLS